MKKISKPYLQSIFIKEINNLDYGQSYTFAKL